jgi:hypothetical protein
VIVLSIGGTILSVTTMAPAWRRLKRHALSLALLKRFARRSPLASREPELVSRS